MQSRMIRRWSGDAKAVDFMTFSDCYRDRKVAMQRKDFLYEVRNVNSKASLFKNLAEKKTRFERQDLVFDNLSSMKGIRRNENGQF